MQMVHIPSSEIKHPNGYHSDQLGFTFLWKGHFLRGIHPQLVANAKRYFDCGFIKEVCDKGLFPKTWISDFENEEFGMIIEHEMIYPNIYSTDWNFSMLRDATVTLLEIAKIGRKYGYNMVDCHKLNIMFKNSHPVYVDLGSFIQCPKGATAWRPYRSFVRSYLSILYLWESGASQLAKRLMTPGVEFDEFDFHLYKNPLWRQFPKYLRLHLKCKSTLHGFAATDTPNICNKVEGKNVILRTVLKASKKLINVVKPLRSQRQWSLDLLSRRVSKMSITHNFRRIHDWKRIEELCEAIKTNTPEAKTATVFEPVNAASLQQIINAVGLQHLIAANEIEANSEAVYNEVKALQMPVSCVYYSMDEGRQLLLRNRFPEDRFKSDIVVVPSYKIYCCLKDIMSIDWFVKERIQYSRYGVMFLPVEGDATDLVAYLSKTFEVIIYNTSNCDSILVIRRNTDTHCSYYGR